MNEKGFTAVEMMITLFVVSAAFVLVSSIYATGTRLTDRSEDLLAANSLAFQKLQTYENRKFDDIDDTTLPAIPEENFTTELPASLPGPKAGEVYITDISPTLKDVFVRVKYQSVSGERLVEYRSLIQIGGLGR